LFPFLEYPYLINPPKLLSDEYEAIEMELNFESKNIKGGDNTIKLKYYQIFYKVGISFIFYGNCFIIDNSTKYLNPDINDIKKRKTKNKFCI